VTPHSRIDLSAYVTGVRSGDRTLLARAITLVESERPDDEEIAAALLDALLPYTGAARRIGITGAPGVGKSTFIDALGQYLVRERGERLAVLSIDPSSPTSGGSILGDKTRMARLTAEEAVFLRPSPARGHAGGVARRTREAMLLCEAAGYDNIFVETVGVGQSEVAVRSMVDFFLLLMLPGAGDGLQGIKRGIMEMLDAMVVTKADGEYRERAERARTEFAGALHLFPASPDGWTPRVLTCSALTGAGVDAVWTVVLEHRTHLERSGLLAARREDQALAWFHGLLSSELERLFRADPRVAGRLPALEDAVRSGRATPCAAARELVALFRGA
jgi:LAO/AO transport system kinase